ncbi:MAG: YybH family protein [Syntrophomonadaceae bacterium]
MEVGLGPVPARRRPPLRIRGGMVGMPDADAAVRQVAEAYASAVRSGDAAAVAALFADGAVEMPPGRPAVRGRIAIEEYYRQLFANAKFLEFTLAQDEARSAGDFAFLSGTSRQTIESGGVRHADTGKYLVVLQRVGGARKVLDASYSGDGPCPPPPAAAR